MLSFVVNMHVVGNTDRQTDRYFIDRKKVNQDLFVIEITERDMYNPCICNIVNLLKSYHNIHSMTYITKIMLTGIAIKNIILLFAVWQVQVRNDTF